MSVKDNLIELPAIPFANNNIPVPLTELPNTDYGLLLRRHGQSECVEMMSAENDNI